MNAPSPSCECPVCAGTIGERERVVCPRCDTPHHADCYSYNQGCALFGCNPDRPSTPLPKKWTALNLTGPLGAQVNAVRRMALWSSHASRVTLFLAVAALTFLGVTAWHFTVRFGETTAAQGYAQARYALQPRQHPQDATRIGQVAPDFTLEDLDGTVHSLRDLTRGHVGVLTFWLAHCADCMDSFPKGVSLSSEFAGSGVRFVDVAYLGQSKPTADWVSQMGIRNPVLLDTSGTVVTQFRVGTYTCFVLDEAGVIRYRGSVDGAFGAVGELLGKRARRKG